MSQTQAIPGLDRDRLLGLAFRMLGTIADAEDAVQEAFVRWYRLDDAARHDVHNLVGWFATTTSRICLDVLGSATRRRELYVGPWLPEPVPDARFLGGALAEAADPLDQLATADAVSMALLAVMERMTPAERVAFVLRDVFEYSAADIAEILGRSAGAARQLASSARAKVAESTDLPESGTRPAVRRAEQARVNSAFLRAVRTGNMDDLLEALDPEVTLRSDGGGVVRAALRPITGASKVARFMRGVMRLQAPVTLALHETPSGPVIVFIREGAVTGVLELVAHGSLVTEMLVQWNPHKLGMWQELSLSPSRHSV